mmetsp:Transcript_35170/g.75867  ORF Transcript_35170/g.75867 Transcript_35170/m.75867 type:complete len:223 (-) Transcript_35170:1712-2380(-)
MEGSAADLEPAPSLANWAARGLLPADSEGAGVLKTMRSLKSRLLSCRQPLLEEPRDDEDEDEDDDDDLDLEPEEDRDFRCFSLLSLPPRRRLRCLPLPLRLDDEEDREERLLPESEGEPSWWSGTPSSGSTSTMAASMAEMPSPPRAIAAQAACASSPSQALLSPSAAVRRKLSCFSGTERSLSSKSWWLLLPSSLSSAASAASIRPEEGCRRLCCCCSWWC